MTKIKRKKIEAFLKKNSGFVLMTGCAVKYDWISSEYDWMGSKYEWIYSKYKWFVLNMTGLILYITGFCQIQLW